LRPDYENRISSVLTMYDQIDVKIHNYGFDGALAGQSDPKKVSSIQKNKALTFKVMLERYKEIYYTGNDYKYDYELAKLKVLLDNMTECLNTALYYGIESQDAKWYVSVLNQSVTLIKNKIFKTYYRQENSE